MDPSTSTARRRRLQEISEALPERTAALSRLFLSRTTIGISRTEIGVLRSLCDGPRRVTDLAAEESVTQPAITLLVNRLQERGWVDRVPDPSDGRAVLVSVTADGQRAVAQIRAEYRELLYEQMAELDDGEVQTLAHAVQILDRLVDRLAARVA